MAKNSQIYSANNPYGNRDEEIRKAKGNPNKNIHAKKKNSNYGGYNGAAEKAHKAAEEKSTLNKLPTWMKVTLIVDIVVIVVLLILRLGVLKNNAPLSYITTLFLGLTIAVRMQAEYFLTKQTLLIMALGLVAFMFDTAGGVLVAKLINLFLPKDKKLNPMIGACGISAFPMSARVVYKMAIKEDPQNYLLMQCVGVNVSGQVASVIAGGLLLNLLV